MANWKSGDEVDAGLSALRTHDASPERIERIRARCLAALAGASAKGEAAAARAAAWRSWLEPALALGLGALYLAEAVTRALSVYR